MTNPPRPDRWRWYLALIFLLTNRDIRVRYKRAWLGLVWALGMPLILTVLFSLVFKGFFRAPIDRYPAYILSSLFPWLFFQGAVTAATMSFLTSAEIVKRMPVPRPVLPLAAVLVEAFHLVVALLLLVCAAGPTNLAVPGWHWIGILPAVFILLAFTAGVGMLLAPLQARFRDVKYLVEIMLLLLFYATPIIYTPEMVPPEWRTWLSWNPLAFLLQPFREILYAGRWPAFSYWPIAGLGAAVVLASGFMISLYGGKNAADHV